MAINPFRATESFDWSCYVFDTASVTGSGVLNAESVEMAIALAPESDLSGRRIIHVGSTQQEYAIIIKGLADPRNEFYRLFEARAVFRLMITGRGASYRGEVAIVSLEYHRPKPDCPLGMRYAGGRWIDFGEPTPPLFDVHLRGVGKPELLIA